MTRIRHIQQNNFSVAELIDGCKQKKPQSQKMLFEKFAPLIYTTCRRYDFAGYPAKDLLQDTFIKVFEKIDQFDERKGQLKNWIARVSINLALNAIRKNKKVVIVIDEEIQANFVYDSDDMLTPNLSEEEILALISKLPVGYKTVFNLFVIDGFSHKKIADSLNISISTSKSQLYKAKQILQKQINQIIKAKHG